MTLDFLSNHGVIVGVVTMLVSFTTPLYSVYYICSYYFKRLGDAKYFLPDDPDLDAKFNQMLRSLAIYMPICIASCFMIFGIVKKRHLYLTSWLTAAFVLSLYSSGVSIYKAVTTDTFRFDDYLFVILALGGSVIVLYPFYHLTLNIRRERAISHLRDFRRNYEHNILSNCELGTEKSTQCI